MNKTATATKEVQVLHIYRFRQVARICFEVLSSDNETHYNTCFNNDAQHGVCQCDRFVKGHKECYHIKNLRPQAQAYFESRQPTEAKMDEMAAYYEAEEDETPGLDAAEAYLASLRQQAQAQQVQPSAEDKEYAEAKRLATAWQTEADPTLGDETYSAKLRRLERERADRMRNAPLNNNNKAFSLMR